MRAKNISVTDLDVLMHKAVMASNFNNNRKPSDDSCEPVLDNSSEQIVSGNTSGYTGRQNILNCCYDTKTANTIFNGLYDDMTSVIIDGLSDTITTIVNDLVDRVYTKYENQYAHKKEQKIALWKQMLNILPAIDVNVLSDISSYLEDDDYWFPDGIEDDYGTDTGNEGEEQ